jgi:cell wall-associated NlpC family hydrolase
MSLTLNVNVSTRINGSQLGGVSSNLNAPAPQPQPLGQVTPRAMVDGFERPAASVNQRVMQAAEELRGMSTRNGPGGGNVACAFAVNKVLARAGVPTLGANPNYVPSVEEALRGGRGRQVSPSEARPGDIVVSPGQSHVGIYLGEGRVLSNSSSRAAFRWESGLNFDGYYGGGQSRIYRLNP